MPDNTRLGVLSLIRLLPQTVGAVVMAPWRLKRTRSLGCKFLPRHCLVRMVNGSRPLGAPSSLSHVIAGRLFGFAHM